MGEDRADWRVAVLCSVLANINRGEKTEEYKPEQFLHYFDFERRWMPEPEPDPIAHAERIRAKVRQAQERLEASR